MHGVFKSVNIHFFDSKKRCLYNFCQLFISLSSFVSSFGQKGCFQHFYFFCNKYRSFHLVVSILVTTFFQSLHHTLASTQIFCFQKWKYNSPYFTEEIFIFFVQGIKYFVCFAFMKSISVITCFFFLSLLVVWYTKSYYLLLINLKRFQPTH